MSYDIPRFPFEDAGKPWKNLGVLGRRESEAIYRSAGFSETMPVQQDVVRYKNGWVGGPLMWIRVETVGFDTVHIISECLLRGRQTA